MSQPQVPPRPARSQGQQQATAAAPGTVPAPVVPPRPARRDDRSESPRSNYPRSPLNDSPFPVESSNDLQRVASLNASRSNLDLPARPPSVSLPSIGQEGIEYDARSPAEEEAISGVDDGPGQSPQHTRKVSSDLPLHAPRPSLSSSDAKQRVAAVVKGDTRVAKHGAPSPGLKSKPSFGQRPPSSASQDRPSSSYGADEQGIPHLGQYVPLGHQYGDVQAPSPAPLGSQSHTPTALGFDAARPGSGRNHARKHSGRNDFQAPPGSYGLHGHGVHDTSDPFEKDWLQKHPDAFKEEIAAHSPAILDRHDYNLTPAELNRLVKQSRAAGFGTSGTPGMPDEQIGYLVSEKYSSRETTPLSTPGLENTKTLGHQSYAPHADSPLKRASVTAEDLQKAAALNAAASANTTHVDAPDHRESKHLGRGQAAASEHEDLGPRGGNTKEEGGWHDESGYGVPILASDEIDPTGSYLQPAVPPISEGRRGSAQGFEDHSRPGSRPSSRPGSIHNVPALGRVTSRDERHTPLEDVREYEPLFPEDEGTTNKPLTPADRFKQRPDMKQRFPSRDIWEDAPESVNMSAEVETPEEEPEITKPTFESPEAEGARKGEVSEQERAKLLPRDVRLAQSSFKPHLAQEVRPAMNQRRFPSRDIWEDSPDSTYITTTVGGEEDEPRNLADEAGAVVSTSASLPREGATAGSAALSPPEDAVKSSAQPVVPPRPGRATSPGKVAPQVPTRPARRPSPESEKPSVPPRPAKAAQAGSDEGVPESATEQSLRSIDASAKPKPSVPARPSGSKIAALQAGFMSDLNKKLGLGPQAPKKEEPEEQAEEDKKPLEDARKGRARGPARRKPAASPSATTAAASINAPTRARQFAATSVFNLFDIAPMGTLTATHAETWDEKLNFKDGLEQAAKGVSAAPVAQEVAPAAGFNTSGEKVHAPTVTPEAVRSTAQTESAPALARESEVSAEPDDTGIAGVSTSSASASSKPPAQSASEPSGKQAVSTNETARQEVKTGVQDPVEPQKSSSSGTQTGEMNIVMDKNGSNEQTLHGYKNGSVHQDGYHFVEEGERPKDEQ